MGRGLLFLMVQVIASIGISLLGVWALLRPRHLQNFLNANFALLPAVRSGSDSFALLLRLAGIGLVLYGWLLLSDLRRELLLLGIGRDLS